MDAEEIDDRLSCTTDPVAFLAKRWELQARVKSEKWMTGRFVGGPIRLAPVTHCMA